MHNVLIFIQQALFPASKTSLYFYLQRKGVTCEASDKIKEDKWLSDALVCDWKEADCKDVKPVDVVPLKLCERPCVGKTRKSAREVRSRRDIVSIYYIYIYCYSYYVKYREGVMQ